MIGKLTKLPGKLKNRSNCNRIECVKYSTKEEPLTKIAWGKADSSNGPISNRRNFRFDWWGYPRSGWRVLSLAFHHRRRSAPPRDRRSCFRDYHDSRGGHDVFEPTITYDVGSDHSGSVHSELGCRGRRTLHRIPTRLDWRNIGARLQTIDGPRNDAGPADGSISNGGYADGNGSSANGSDGHDLQELWSFDPCRCDALS
jgi:hypothetical protein